MDLPAVTSPVEQFGALNEIVRSHVIAVLAACRGNRTEAARALGIDRKTIYRMLRRWGIDTAAPQGQSGDSAGASAR
jgi:transcriptional regulator of acetoin/glycerol metabolism